MYELYLSVGLLVSGLVALGVYSDGYLRSDDNAGWWAVGTFLLLIIVLPIYLYHRSHDHDDREGQEDRRMNVSVTTQYGIGHPQRDSKCPKCNHPMREIMNSYYCDKDDLIMNKS